MLRTTFKMALRQTEGLMSSVLTLMNLTTTAPDHTRVSRREQGLTATKSTSTSTLAPKGPLHVLIDSTSLQVFGADNGWKKSTVISRTAPGVSYISQSMPTPA